VAPALSAALLVAGSRRTRCGCEQLQCARRWCACWPPGAGTTKQLRCRRTPTVPARRATSMIRMSPTPMARAATSQRSSHRPAGCDGCSRTSTWRASSTCSVPKPPRPRPRPPTPPWATTMRWPRSSCPLPPPPSRTTRPRPEPSPPRRSPPPTCSRRRSPASSTGRTTRAATKPSFATWDVCCGAARSKRSRCRRCCRSPRTRRHGATVRSSTASSTRWRRCCSRRVSSTSSRWGRPMPKALVD